MSVLVYTENWDGKFKKSSFELVSYAHAVAQSLGTDVVALSIGNVADEELEKLATYGASKIFKESAAILAVLDNKAYAKVIASAAKKVDAQLVLMANNNNGKAVAPRVAVRLKAGFASGVNALPISFDPFKVKKQVYNGKAKGIQQINSAVKVLTLAQNSFELIENAKDFLVEEYHGEVVDSDVSTKVVSTEKVSGKLLLSDADIVVSGGRGMKSPDNWGPLEELAEVLGAGTACSRPVSDEGWRGHEEHVGQTGKAIAPNLYFALGISGAIQHLAGVSSSKVIVAVNTDAEAPMFTAADYGIVGDLKEILPRLVEEAKKFKERI